MAALVNEYKALLEKRSELNNAIDTAEEKMVMAPELQEPLVKQFLTVLEERFVDQGIEHVLAYLKDNLACVPMFCTESWITDNDDEKESTTLFYKLHTGETIMYTYVTHDCDDVVHYFGRDGPDEEAYEDLPESWDLSESLKQYVKPAMKFINKLKTGQNFNQLPKELEAFWLLFLICSDAPFLNPDKLEYCIDYCAYVDELSGVYEDAESDD